MTKRYWIAALPALVTGMVACSGEGLDGEFEFATSDSELTLMPKPGTQVAPSTEAGRDIEQVGVYTLYSAQNDTNAIGEQQGSVHLFKNNAPFRSYQARAFYGSQMGPSVGLSENWAAASLLFFPVAPGRIEDAIMLIGKSGGDFASCGSIAANGTLPNCVACTGSLANNNLSCTPTAAGIQIIQAPIGSSFSKPLFEFEGNDLMVGSRDGSSQVFHLRHNGSQWVYLSPIPGPVSGEAFGTAIAVSGNLMAIGASQTNGTGRVYVYQRQNATSPWQPKLRIDPPAGRNITRFGEQLDLSGTSLIVGAQGNALFIELAPQNFATPSTALSESCALFTNSALVADVGVSGTRAVVTNSGMPFIFNRSTTWNFYGGLPSGIFPHDGEGATNFSGSTAFSLWGADIDGSRVAIGWRNYRGSNPDTETGAAIGFTFEDYGCGQQMGLPGTGLVHAKQFIPPGVNAPNYAAYPETLAIDGNSDTRWMAPATGGTQFEIDLGQLRVLSHLEINWGVRYANDYLIQVSDDPDSVPAGQRNWRWATHITGEDGNTDFVNLRNASESFARRVRLTMNGFGTLSGQSDQGVSIKELRVYGKVHDSCHNKPALNCSSAKATASAVSN